MTTTAEDRESSKQHLLISRCRWRLQPCSGGSAPPGRRGHPHEARAKGFVSSKGGQGVAGCVSEKGFSKLKQHKCENNQRTLMRNVNLLLSPVDRATIQSPRIYPVSGSSPPAAFHHSPEPGSRLRPPCRPTTELGSADSPGYRKPGLCGWPVTSGGADHTARQCPTARQLGARQQCASGDEVKSPPHLMK